VFAGAEIVRAAIEGREQHLTIAAINGPENTVVSGDRAALSDVLSRLEAGGVRSRLLKTSHACHSPLLDDVLQPLEGVLRTVQFSEPAIEFVSTLTGRVTVPGELVDPAYWVRHVRETVRFASAIDALWARGCRTFVEIGPSATLVGLGRRCQPSEEGAWLATLHHGKGDWTQIADTLAAIFARGGAVDWQAWDAPYSRSRVTLPTYPFQRERYWTPPRPQLHAAVLPAGATTEPAVWHAATNAASDQADRAPLDLHVDSYSGKWRTLEALTTEYMVRALNQLGAFTSSGETSTVESFLTRFGILVEYRVLIGRWLGKLASEGLLEVSGDQYIARSALRQADVAGALESARTAFAADNAFLSYVSNCGEQLVEVLTGKESPLETLFPGGRSDLAAAIYETSPVARYINGIARAGVAAAAGRRSGRPFRILEIGAGTGGTTAALLPVLGDGGSYTFTDIGSLFLSKARDRFSGFPFVEYAQLDIERDPVDQGFHPATYDVVVAANVLHATRNLHTTMDRALGLLGPGGMLVLLETTRHPSWFDISTGLIHGWQIFEDDLRTDHPLIDADRWQSLLREHGAEAVECYPANGSPAEVFGQHVLLARRSTDVVVGTATSATTKQTVGGAVPAPVAETAQLPDLRDRLAAASSDEVDELLVDFVSQQVASVLRFDPASLDPGARLMDLGVDSLMAVELRNRLAAGLQLKRRPSATLIFDHPTVRAIAGYLRRDVLKIADAPPAPAPAADDRQMVTAAALGVAALDDQAIEALLNKTLETL
jgi:malonyl CoA-acyl carrier protein transacylase